MPPCVLFGSSNGVYTSPALSFATPTDARTGDVLLCAIAGPTTWTATAPSGWELLAQNVAGSPAQRSAVFRRTVTASEPATQLFTVGASLAVAPAGVLMLWRGTDPSAALVQSAQAAIATAAAAHAAPAVTLVRYSDLLLQLFYATDAAGTGALTPPSGATLLATARGAGGGSLAVCSVLRETVGTTGTQTGTWAPNQTGIASQWAVAAVPTQVAPALTDTVPGAIGLPVVGV